MEKDFQQFKATMRQRFEAQLTDLERALLQPEWLLQLCFDYYMEGWLAAAVPEYDADLATGCADDNDHELNQALRQITPERLNQILAERN